MKTHRRGERGERRGERESGFGARGAGLGALDWPPATDHWPLFPLPPSPFPLARSLSPASRRGVLLLLVLALLSMFGLIAVAFVVLTGHAQRGAKSIERLGQAESLTDSSSATLLRQAALQILRGPANTASVIGAHSLPRGHVRQRVRIRNGGDAGCGRVDGRHREHGTIDERSARHHGGDLDERIRKHHRRYTAYGHQRGSGDCRGTSAAY